MELCKTPRESLSALSNDLGEIIGGVVILFLLFSFGLGSFEIFVEWVGVFWPVIKKLNVVFVMIAYTLLTGLLAYVFFNLNPKKDLSDELLFSIQLCAASILLAVTSLCIYSGTIKRIIFLDRPVDWLGLVMSPLAFSPLYFTGGIIILWISTIAKERRKNTLLTDFKLGNFREFLPIRDLLVLEHGWHKNQIGKNGQDYMIDLKGKTPIFTNHSSSDQSATRPATAISKIFREGAHLIILRNPHTIDDDSENVSRHFFNLVDEELLDHLFGIRWQLDNSRSIIAKNLSGEKDLNLPLDLLFYPSYLLVSRKAIRFNGKLKTLFGW